MIFVTLRNQIRLQPTKVMTFMKIKDSMQRWVRLLLGLCLIGSIPAYAQQRTSGGGGGNFGSFGGSASRSTGGTGGGSSSANSIYPNSTQLGTASLSVDPETRSVVVVADDETFEKINQLIARLDRPKPQVLIKVVFLEVTHSDDLDFGVEGSYSPNLGGSIQTNALASIFGLASQGAAGSTIGPNTMPTGAGIYSIVGNDFTATVRAIASAQKVDVLSRPSILVRNNQPATITVGQSVPLVTGVVFSGYCRHPGQHGCLSKRGHYFAGHAVYHSRWIGGNDCCPANFEPVNRNGPNLHQCLCARH